MTQSENRHASRRFFGGPVGLLLTGDHLFAARRAARVVPNSLLTLIFVLCVSHVSAAADSKNGRIYFEQRTAAEPATEVPEFTLQGPTAQLQLIVTEISAGGVKTDRTTNVVYESGSEGIVSIGPNGLVVPVAEGRARISARSQNGDRCEAIIVVQRIADPPTIDFSNQIVPLLTRHGCNGGGCHGKSGGQNGFRLSLLGFYPDEDYEYLCKEARGRRIFPAFPAESLLLKKATGALPHGGGSRIAEDSIDYQVLTEWIRQGMPEGDSDSPQMTGLRCLPDARTMPTDHQQQLAVIAEYSDGSEVDVTRMSLFEANNSEMADCSSTGLVRTGDLAGVVAVMARYQGEVAVFTATIPMGAETGPLPEPRNVVDQHVFANLSELGIPPSPECDDATFLRRVTVDIAGRLPAEEEVIEFLGDTRSDKRDRLIDRLLDSPDYSAHFANKWNLILRNRKERPEDQTATVLFHNWIRDCIQENMPYDQFVSSLLTASGDYHVQPAVTWYREVDTIEEQVEDTAQLFLGVRLQCARCHHHPFERWSQDDYFRFAAFFSRLGREPIPYAGANVRDRRLVHRVGLAESRNPRTGTRLTPAGLGAGPAVLDDATDPREALAAWLTRADNPFFARMLVNRYWKHFFGRGLVDPEDDLRDTNPPSNPELLDATAAAFIDSGYDLKHLIRLICRSRTYQLSSLPNEANSTDEQNFSRFYPRRLSAEVLYDGFHQATGTREDFPGLPAGTRAVELPDISQAPLFLKVFGQPEAETACECERSPNANLAQSLHLLNSPEVQKKLNAAQGRAAVLSAASEASAGERVSALYRWIYARNPTSEELQTAIKYIQDRGAREREAFEDLIWALVNTKEFLFNH